MVFFLAPSTIAKGGKERDRMQKMQALIGMRFGLMQRDRGSVATIEAILAMFRMDCRILVGEIRCLARPSQGRDLPTLEFSISSIYYVFRVYSG